MSNTPAAAPANNEENRRKGRSCCCTHPKCDKKTVADSHRISSFKDQSYREKVVKILILLTRSSETKFWLIPMATVCTLRTGVSLTRRSCTGLVLRTTRSSQVLSPNPWQMPKIGPPLSSGLLFAPRLLPLVCQLPLSLD